MIPDPLHEFWSTEGCSNLSVGDDFRCTPSLSYMHVHYCNRKATSHDDGVTKDHAISPRTTLSQQTAYSRYRCASWAVKQCLWINSVRSRMGANQTLARLGSQARVQRKRTNAIVQGISAGRTGNSG